jgi:hypothetical protein
MELVDMNSLGLFDSNILSVQVGFTLIYFLFIAMKIYVCIYANVFIIIIICCRLIGKS